MYYSRQANVLKEARMSKPIYATPKMDKAESRRIYGELRQTKPTREKEEQLRQADGVYERARQRAQKTAGARGTGTTR